MFDVNRPVNQNEANLHGWELGGQYFFGDTGFGIFANYTIVQGDVGFDDAGDPEHRPVRPARPERYRQRHVHVREVRLVARLAWNWRDEYLILANQGATAIRTTSRTTTSGT